MYVPVQIFNAFMEAYPKTKSLPVQFPQVVKLVQMLSDMKSIKRHATWFEIMLRAYLKKRFSIKFGNKQKDEMINYIFQTSEHLFRNAMHPRE